jgi:signal transduction histidine kinase
MTAAPMNPSRDEPMPTAPADADRVDSEELLPESLTRTYERSEQRLDFFSAVAHDLKGPLTTIKGHAQLILRRARKSEMLSSASVIADAERIESTASRMADLISETLDMTKIELGRALDLVPRVVDLVALLSSVVEGEGRISFTSDQETILGVFDELRLKRVVKNLVSNALLYSPPESEVKVSLRRISGAPGQMVELTVQDEGIGIPEDQVASVFDCFFRARNVPDSSYGLGMGLASVRQIVEQLQGIATVESIEGKGTTARVLLPIQEPGEHQI